MTIDWSGFTPWSSLLGGFLIGLSASLLLLLNGRIAGVSGIVGGLLSGRWRELSWRLCFIAGLMASPLVFQLLLGSMQPITIRTSTPLLCMAGFLVGIGTRYASGCTSGHGVCGLSRRSLRSLVATITFMTAGFATTFVMLHVLG